MKRLCLFLLLSAPAILAAQHTWTQKNPPPFAGRYAAVSFVIGDHAYAGLGSVNAEERTYSAGFYRYDPGPDTWTRLADFPGGARYSACAFAVNGKGYVCNGVDPSQQWRQDVWEFDPLTESWSKKGDFAGGVRYNSSAFVIGDRAYLVAGSVNAGFNYLWDLWCYAPATDTWVRKADLPVQHKSGPVAFSMNGFGYAGCGSENTYSTTADFFRYDPVSDTWITLPNLPGPRTGALGFVLNDTAYVGTGSDLMTTFKSFVTYTGNAPAWTAMPDPPADFSARFGSTAFTIGNTAYILSGRNRPYDPFYDPGEMLTDLWAFGGCSDPVAGFTSEIRDSVVAFHDTSLSATQYAWAFGDGTSSTDKNPVHTYPHPGTYTVCHGVANGCGTDSLCMSVVIPCRSPEARIGYSVNYPEVQFSDLSVTGSLTGRLWDFGDGSTSTEENPLHTFADPGSFTVCLSVSDSCGFDSICGTLVLYQPMVLQVSAVPVATNDRMAQFADNTPGTTYWHWDFGDGTTSGLQHPSHLYKEYGTYIVCLEAGNSTAMGNWCDTLQMDVNPALHIAHPVLVYPNPASERIFVRVFRDFPETTVRMSDLTGVPVLEKRLLITPLSGPEEIRLDGLAAGIYFVRVSCGSFDKVWKVAVR